MADANVDLSSLDDLMQAYGDWQFKTAGRPQSANIEDRRHDGPMDGIETILVQLEEQAAKNKEWQSYVHAVMDGYPGQPMPTLNRVTNKLMTARNPLPTLGYDVSEY
jgi:hypothetical protein